jgi:hypothetical protein
MHGPTCIFWANLTPCSLQFVNLLRGRGNCIAAGACDPASPVLRQFDVPTTESLVDAEGHAVSSAVRAAQGRLSALSVFR